jgi:hypothetical protein
MADEAINRFLKNSLGYIILSEEQDLLNSFFSKIQQMLLPLYGTIRAVRFFNNLLRRIRQSQWIQSFNSTDSSPRRDARPPSLQGRGNGLRVGWQAVEMSRRENVAASRPGGAAIRSMLSMLLGSVKPPLQYFSTSCWCD